MNNPPAAVPRHHQSLDVAAHGGWLVAGAATFAAGLAPTMRVVVGG